MDNFVPIVLLVAFGLIFGYRTWRSSHKRETSSATGIAQVFHYLASGIMATVTPTVLTCVIIFETGLIPAVLVGVAMFIIALLLLIPYAIFEKSAQDRAAAKLDRGWTREDALSSGL